MTNKSFGCVGIIGEAGRLIGIITDGDLRRHLAPSLFASTARQVMTPDPKTRPPAPMRWPPRRCAS
jgi:arabinose-5-phosphate isomerase